MTGYCMELNTGLKWVNVPADEDELFLWNSLPTKRVKTVFPAGAIVRGSHHRKSRHAVSWM